MPRSASVSIENNFIKGLVTEVTGANSPENSVTETVDVVYDRTGRATTRKGLDFEESFVLNNLNDTAGIYNEYLWETVSENTPVAFQVIQTGRYITFYETELGQPVSGGMKSFVVDLDTFRVSTFTIDTVKQNYCSFSSGKGYLFVAHPNCETFYIKYDSGTDTISATAIDILIRDFEGVEDGLDNMTRPVVETAAHKYNTYNQGWYATVQIPGGAEVQAYDHWHTQVGNYPSNTDFWWFYTTPDVSGGTTGTDQFNPADTVAANTALLGNTPAPKGHYIMSANNMTRSSIIPGAQNTTSNGYRPNVVAFYAGRAFYAGIGAPGYSSTVYFSQIIERDNQVGRCYQENDPTSREYFDLLPTDGGTVKIQDINNIIDMRVIGQDLYIFASNGVWTIGGTAETPFKATDYAVTKVSSFPVLSRLSIVDIGGLPIWWNYEGIYALQKDQLGSAGVNNLSQEVIQTFYDSISPTAKTKAKGRYNEQSGLIYWLYNTSDPSQKWYDRVLVYDTVSSAFYVLTLPVGTRQIVGITALTAEEARIFKFVTIQGSQITFTEYRNNDPVDYPSDQALAVSASFISGYRIRGDLLKKFQTNYLTLVTEPHEFNGSCFVQGLWDWTNHPDSGRYTNPQQVYRYRDNRSYQRSKLKIRGNGYSLQFKFFNEAGKPFTIVAWAGFETANQVP